jgi:hypothetical protein
MFFMVPPPDCILGGPGSDMKSAAFPFTRRDSGMPAGPKASLFPMGHLQRMDRLFLPVSRRVSSFEYLMLRPGRVRLFQACVEIFSRPGLLLAADHFRVTLQ